MAEDFAALKISIEANLKDFSAKMGEFEQILKGTEDQTKKTGAGFGEMAAGFITAEAAMEGFKKAINFTKEAVQGLDDDLMTQLRLTKSLGEDGVRDLMKLTTAMSVSTRFSKDDLDVAAQKLTIHKLNREEIEKLIPVITDYATKSGSSAVSTAEAFGRAIEYGSTRGLRPFGIEVEKTGSQLDTFNAILQQGTLPSVKGLAVEAANIGQGQLLIMQNAMGEIKDTLGEKLLPIFTEVVVFLKDDAMPVLVGVIDNLDTLLPVIKGVGEMLATYFVVSKLSAYTTGIVSFSGAIDGVGIAGKGALEKIGTAAAANPIGMALLIGMATYQGATAIFQVTGFTKYLEGVGVGISQAIHKSQEKYRKYKAGFNEQGEMVTTPVTPDEGLMSFEAVDVMKETSALSTEDRGGAPKGVKETADERAIRLTAEFNAVPGYRASQGNLDRTNAATTQSLWAADEKEQEESSAKHHKKMLEQERQAYSAEMTLKRMMAKTRKQVLAIDEEEELASVEGNERAILAIKKKYAILRKNIAEQEIEEGTARTVENLAYLAERHKEWANSYKTVAIAMTLWDTYKGAQAVFTGFNESLPQPAGLIAGTAAAVIATAAGLARVEEIETQKFHDGGEVKATLLTGEYVMNRNAVNMYGRQTMEAINTGTAPRGGSVVTGGKSGGGSTTIINTVDPGLLEKYLATSSGQRAITNVIRAKRFEVNKVLQ